MIVGYNKLDGTVVSVSSEDNIDNWYRAQTVLLQSTYKIIVKNPETGEATEKMIEDVYVNVYGTGLRTKMDDVIKQNMGFILITNKSKKEYLETTVAEKHLVPVEVAKDYEGMIVEWNPDDHENAYRMGDNKEFVPYVERLTGNRVPTVTEEFYEANKKNFIFGYDPDGFITKESIMRSHIMMSNPITEEQAEEILREIQTNTDQWRVVLAQSLFSCRVDLNNPKIFVSAFDLRQQENLEEAPQL